MLPNLLNNQSLQNSVRDNINVLDKTNQSLNDSLMSVGKSQNFSTLGGFTGGL